jgi:hypothetical protein
MHFNDMTILRRSVQRIGRQAASQDRHPTAKIDSRETGIDCCSCGRYTKAASRCVHSSSDISRCVVPSRQGVSSFKHLPSGVALRPLVRQHRAGSNCVHGDNAVAAALAMRTAAQAAGFALKQLPEMVA